jgi:undecaprenyl diphosphate synthase
MSKAKSTIPAHVAIIMDGNGRWAKARGLPRLAGHRAGTENVRPILEAAVDCGIEILTIWAFSTENWQRPDAEVKGLLRILELMIRRELKELHKNGVRLRHIGRLDRLPERLQKQVLDAVELTKQNKRIVLNVAFDYGGRAEIIQAVQQIMRKGIPADQVNEELLSQHMYTAGQPDPDLIIRTGGELRTSGFMLWQSAYTEYYITPTYWPDFGQPELCEALTAFRQRERRFGAIKDDYGYSADLTEEAEESEDRLGAQPE